MLALNIVDRSFIGLTHQLNYDQGAPVGFLFIEKFITLSFGNNEYSLRLFPFISSIISLYLLYKLSKKCIGLQVAPIALGLFAFCYRLTIFASEVKQYSSDVMTAIILLILAYNCFHENSKPKDFWILGITGALALWISHPAFFILFGIGLTLVADVFLRKDPQRYSQAGYTFVLWLISFSVDYLISLRHLTENTVLLDYWHSSFMPLPPWNSFPWLYITIKEMLAFATLTYNDYLLCGFAALFFLGICSLFVRKWQMGLTISLTFLMLFTASALHRYPVRGRLLLFVIPIIIIVVSEGVGQIYLTVKKYNSMAALAALIIIGTTAAFAPAQTSLDFLKHPNVLEDIKPVLSYLEKHKKNTDLVYVYYGALHAVQYYGPRYGLDKNGYIAGIESRGDPQRYLLDMDKLKGKGRVWVILSHNYARNRNTPSEWLFFLSHFNKLGKCLDSFIASGSCVYLYDLYE